MKQNQKVFKEGVAQSYIQSITENLPSIMFVLGLMLRACIAGLLCMHAYDLFSFIKNEKIKVGIVISSVLPLEFLFISFSLATAQIRHKAYSLKDVGFELQASRLLTWSWIFFTVTILGSLGFNTAMLYFAQTAQKAVNVTNDIANNSVINEVSAFFSIISNKKSWEVFIAIQFVNVTALFAVEGSAFLLNSNTDTHTEPQKTGKKQSNDNWEVVTDGTIAQKLREKLHNKTFSN